MAVISFIFFSFLAAVAAIGCLRALKIVVKMVNHMFDKIEDKFD